MDFFKSSTHSHHSALSLLPLASLRPRGVVFRSLSSERCPPTVTTGRWWWGEGGVTWRVTPTHHEPQPELASLEHAAFARETAIARSDAALSAVTSHPSPTIRALDRLHSSVHVRQSGIGDQMECFLPR